MPDQNTAAPSAPAAAPEKQSSSSPVSSASSRSDPRTGGATIRNKRNLRLYLAGGSLVLLVAGLLSWRYLSSYESTDDAQVDVHLYPVSPRISGYVIKVNVDDNEYVEKGRVLVEIDPKDYEVAVAQAQAALNNAEATAKSLNITVPIASISTESQISASASDVENAKAGVLASQKQLTAAHAQVEQTEANDVKLQDDVQRYKLLVEKKEIADQIYDQAVSAAKASTASIAASKANEAAAEEAVRQAEARLTAAGANYRSAQTGPQQVSSTRARAQAAIADVEQKRAVLEQAKLNLQYTKVVAPVGGEVNKTVVVGLNVQPGQQLLTVVPLEEVWITANFKETQLRHMTVGQKANVKVDSNGRSYKGHVDSVAGATGPLFSLLPPENATGNYVKIVQRIPVKIVLEPGENKDRQLRPGMNVEPKVHLR
jgi:membrane fusion protein (multidrug efflux system)